MRVQTVDQEWYWISFVDFGTKKCSGVAIVSSPCGDADLVLSIAQVRGCNPGGQAAFYPLPREVAHTITPDVVNRLLSQDEARALCELHDSILKLNTSVAARPEETAPAVEWDGVVWPPPIGARVRAREDWRYGGQDCDDHGKRTAGTVLAEPGYVAEMYRGIPTKPGVWAWVTWDGGNHNMYEASDIEPAPQN